MLISIASGPCETLGVSAQSPTRLGHARKHAFERQFSETDAAELELSRKTARPSAALTAASSPDRELRRLSCFRHPCLSCHLLFSYSISI